jgi:hypothetical protein
MISKTSRSSVVGERCITPIDERVDWNAVKRCLAILHRESPTFLSQSLLIGGAACWFYRVQLENSRDTDFHLAPELSRSDLWLSKDIDFTAIFRVDAYDLLSALVTKEPSGNRILKVGGIRIGFAQGGVTFDPQEAFQRARVGEFIENGANVQFLVIDPVTLYREKQALSQKRNQPNDHAHFAALKEFLCYDFLNACAQFLKPRNLEQQTNDLGFIIDVRKRTPEILQDSRVLARLNSLPTSPNSPLLQTALR